MNENVKIFVFKHRDVKISQKYKNNEIYVPIQLGYRNRSEINIYNDSTGDNISYLNPYLNELTGFYWIYKHYNEIGNPENIGFMHYRRYLLWDKMKLSEDNIQFAIEPYHISFIKQYYYNRRHLCLLINSVFQTLVSNELNIDINDLMKYLFTDRNKIYGREMFVTSRKIFFYMMENFILKYIKLSRKILSNIELLSKYGIGFSQALEYFCNSKQSNDDTHYSNDDQINVRKLGCAFEILFSYYIYAHISKKFNLIEKRYMKYI